MTGKDLIIYILQNNLENEEIFKDGVFLGCMTVEEVAVKLNVGLTAVRAWNDIGYLDGIKINDTLYILPNYKYNMLLNMTVSHEKFTTDIIKQING